MPALTALLSIASWVCLGLGAAVAVLNWVTLLVWCVHRLKGIRRHTSFLPPLGLPLLLLAFVLRQVANTTSPSDVLLLTVAVSDPSAWSLLALPFYLAWRAVRGT